MDKQYKIITEKELFEIITTFYSNEDEKDIHIEKSLQIINGELSLTLYLVKDNNKYIITHEDLEYVFKFYLHSCGLEYDSFRFIGNIRRPGYYIDEETPIFEGVKLSYYENNKTKKLSLS